MTNIFPIKNKENENEKIHLGTFNRKGFLENIGNKIYEGLDSKDYKGMYERAYKVFKHNQGCPIKIGPEPPTPKEIKEKFTLETLSAIEPLLSVQYGGGLGVFCKMLGREKADKEVKTMFGK